MKIFMVASPWLSSEPLQEFTQFTGRMQTQQQMAANPQTKPDNLGCESTGRQLPSTSTIAIVIITQLILPSHGGWKAGYAVVSFELVISKTIYNAADQGQAPVQSAFANAIRNKNFLADARNL